MPGSRRLRLEAVPGWSWGVWEDLFDQGVAALRVFAAREGHLRVPPGHEEGRVRLGEFARSYARAEPYVGDDRRRALEAVPGWRWDRSPGGPGW